MSKSRNHPVLEQPLPNNLDAERSVLGAVLLENSALDNVIAHVRAEDFFLEENRRVFLEMVALREAQQPIDLITLTDELYRHGRLEEAGGAPYLSSLPDGMPRVSNVEHYARIVKEKSLLRSLIHSAENIQLRAFEEEDGAVAVATYAAESMSTIAASALPTSTWRRKFHTPGELKDRDTNFLVTGLVSKGVVFIGALSGAGKTWFSLSLARALTTGKPFLGVWPVPAHVNCLYMCPEMGEAAFKHRLQRFGIEQNFYCMTISDGSPLDLADPLLAAAIRELKPILFLDTAIRFSKSDEENSSAQNSNGLAKSIFELLHLGAQAVICLHHRAKETARVEEMSLENTLRGTSDLGAVADCVIGLQVDRGDGTLAYLAESRKLVRLAVRVVKARDFRPPDDFRIQLEPFIDEIHDMAVLREESRSQVDSEIALLAEAIARTPQATKVQLSEATAIGRNRIEKLAEQAGWTYTRNSGWTKEPR